MTMRQLVKKAKGSASFYDDDSIEFTPQGKGEKVYESSVRVGEATMGLTAKKTAASKQNYVAKLKAAADASDPIEDMHEQLDKLAAKVFPKTAYEPKPRGKVLLKDKGQYVAVNAKTGVLSIHLDIDLSESCDYGTKIANFIIESNKCLYTNQDLLRRVCRATAKPSNQ